MLFFQDLGALIEKRWSGEDYSEESFPALATQALIESAPHKQVNPWDIIRWVNTTPQLPAQQDVAGRFGNPPITLFNGPRFYIDVYYWLDGTTSIHQHSFSGAFQVFLGSSIHSQYDFEEKQKVNAHFSVGEVALKSVELLTQGDTRPILPGKRYIHSLFHLDRPSATVTVRTRSTPAALPQYNYHKPYFAVDPFYESPVMLKRLQSTFLLLGMKHPDADELIGELLSTSDFQTAFQTIEIAYNHLPHDPIEESFGVSAGKNRFEDLLEKARRRHGDLVGLIQPVFEEVERQNFIIRRRAQITGSEHRFFLALLLNVPDRGKILDLVRSRFPEQDPVETIAEWVEELANTKVFGSSEPNVLGIRDFDDDYLFAFRCLLQGLDIEQTKAAFESDDPTDDASTSGDKLEQLCVSIRESILFKNLLSDLPPTPLRSSNRGLKLVTKRSPERAIQKNKYKNKGKQKKVI